MAEGLFIEKAQIRRVVENRAHLGEAKQVRNAGDDDFGQ